MQVLEFPTHLVRRPICKVSIKPTMYTHPIWGVWCSYFSDQVRFYEEETEIEETPH